ncbi:MAG: hypothetical protein IH994_03495 [Proteobacteria bacterium]|nr:hypothetical protein [Pseudomonadota bacterium]
MTIHDPNTLRTTEDSNESGSSQQGCEQLPAKKAEEAILEAFIEKAGAEIERIEGELRILKAQPGSPDRDRKLTPLGDSLANWENDRSHATRKLLTLLDEIRELESRCIRQA